MLWKSITGPRCGGGRDGTRQGRDQIGVTVLTRGRMEQNGSQRTEEQADWMPRIWDGEDGPALEAGSANRGLGFRGEERSGQVAGVQRHRPDCEAGKKELQ